MFFKSFRPSDGYQHKTVVKFATHLLGKEFKTIVDHFDEMRKKRNIFTYDVDISISMTEASNAINTAEKFVDLIKEIIKKDSPQTHFKF